MARGAHEAASTARAHIDATSNRAPLIRAEVRKSAVANLRLVNVRDLRRDRPRRWNEEIGGIKWLPRLIDKTRAALADCLGGYLYGQSPVDRGLLRALGLGHRAFAKVVADASTDDDVFRALFARSPEGIERARAWSAELPQKFRFLLFLIDIDDGYHEAWYWRILRRPANVISNTLMHVVKLVWPSRAAALD